MSNVRIVAAAIKADGVIYTAKRHFQARDAWWNAIGREEKFTLEMQGFVTNTGKFVSRAEAATIASLAGQIDHDMGEGLTSEDLW